MYVGAGTLRCTTIHVQIEEFAPVREERGLGLHSGFGDRGGGLSRGHHHGREDEKNVLKHREVRRKDIFVA